MDIDKHLLIFGKKKDRKLDPEIFLGYASQVDKSDFFCYEQIILKFISGIPDSEIAKLKNGFNVRNLKKPRAFAEIVLKKMKAENFYGPYLNPAKHPMANEFLPFFSSYMELDKETFKPEYVKDSFLTFVIDLQEFKRIYEPVSLEKNASKGTYAMDPKSFKTKNVDMLSTKLLNENWSKPAMRTEFKNESSKDGEPPIGKKSYFLNPSAAKDLFFFTEAFLKKIGFDVIVLKADTMSLAVKVYGPWGYYPMYKNDDTEVEVNNDGNILVSGNKIENVASKINSNEKAKRLLTCDYTSGPFMFKFLNTDPVPVNIRKGLKYNWLQEQIMCKNPFLKKKMGEEPMPNFSTSKNTRGIPKYGTFSGGKSRQTRQTRKQRK